MALPDACKGRRSLAPRGIRRNFERAAEPTSRPPQPHTDGDEVLRGGRFTLHGEVYSLQKHRVAIILTRAPEFTSVQCELSPFPILDCPRNIEEYLRHDHILGDGTFVV